MKTLAQLYELKDGSVGEPDQYLGANIDKFQLPSKNEVWNMNSCEYCTAAYKKVIEILAKEEKKLKARNDCPYPFSYKSEGDMTEKLRMEST
eukprot:13661038-Ditylum_brightwellii.AAC.1